MCFLFNGVYNWLVEYLENRQRSSTWAKQKHLHINSAKRLEMVVVEKRKPSQAPGAPLAGRIQVSAMKVIGMLVSDRLSVSSHGDAVHVSCTCSVW